MATRRRVRRIRTQPLASRRRPGSRREPVRCRRRRKLGGRCVRRSARIDCRGARRLRARAVASPRHPGLRRRRGRLRVHRCPGHAGASRRRARQRRQPGERSRVDATAADGRSRDATRRGSSSVAARVDESIDSTAHCRRVGGDLSARRARRVRPAGAGRRLARAAAAAAAARRTRHRRAHRVAASSAGRGGQEYAVLAAAARAGVAAADLFPRLVLTGGVGLQSFSVGDVGNRGPRFGLGLGVTLPFLEWNRIRQRILAADATAEIALADYERTALSRSRRPSARSRPICRSGNASAISSSPLDPRVRRPISLASASSSAPTIS